MSHDPAGANLGDAGHGNAAHDQGSMRCDDATKGAQDAAGEQRAEASNSSNKDMKLLAAQQVQEQRSRPTLLDYSSLRGPGLASGDDAAAVAKSQLETGVASLAHDSAPIHDKKVNGTTATDQAGLSTAFAVTSTQPRPTTAIPIPIRSSQEPEQKAQGPLPSADTSPPAIENASAGVTPKPHESKPTTNGTNPPAVKMVFSTSSASASTSNAHRRRVMANTNALTKYEADLTDQDRAKQKEAVRKYLAERVKTDWEWQWPRSDDAQLSRFASLTTDAGDPAGNASDVTEEQWKERDEWLSNTSDGEGPMPSSESGARQDSPTAKEDPFCFGSPESIGNAIRKHELERKRRRKRRLAEEMAYNDGLSCFVQRRDAWTGARHVLPSSDNALSRVRTKRSSIYSLLPGKASPTTVAPDADPDSDNGLARSRTKRSSLYSILPGRSPPPPEAESEREIDPELDRATEIPIAAPILPPANAMRASITPAAYNTIYDKVILQQLTPSCPMNLKDVTRSCVQGWKRDGEWPPKSSEPPKKKNRRMSFVSLFSLDKDRADEKERGEKEGREKRPETPAEGNEKPPKRSSATIGKGIRKIMFWKEKHDGHGSGSGQDAAGEGRNSPTVPPGNS